MMPELLFQASALSGRYTMKVSMLTNMKRPNKTLQKKKKTKRVFLVFLFMSLLHGGPGIKNAQTKTARDNARRKWKCTSRIIWGCGLNMSIIIKYIYALYYKDF